MRSQYSVDSTRYLNKRARADGDVVHNDAVHDFDLSASVMEMCHNRLVHMHTHRSYAYPIGDDAVLSYDGALDGAPLADCHALADNAVGGNLGLGRNLD